MGTVLRMNKMQILFLLLVLLTLLLTALIVLHGTTPNLFHAIVYSPKVIHRH
jgi:hypothetical protein